jgi:hypothetical protein
MRQLVPLLLVLAACGDNLPGPPDGATARTLGLNDVTILLPLPASATTPTLLPLVGGDHDRIAPALFARLVTAPGDVGMAAETFQLVAVRFDLCDRLAPGPCPAGADGRLRLVFQPILPDGSAADVAIHAFYPIPHAALPAVVAELRALSDLAGTPRTDRLTISPPLVAGQAAYRDRLRTLIETYARAEQLTRLTLFAQNLMSQALNWAFRGVELHGAAFDDLVIPGVQAISQRVLLVGEDSYETHPIVDAPAGVALALDHAQFAGAGADAQRAALAGLATVDDPRHTTANDTQCVGCHVATYLTAARGALAGLDPATLGGFTSSYDLHPLGGDDARSLRALGWRGRTPTIALRVATETAAMLEELEATYPVP